MVVSGNSPLTASRPVTLFFSSLLTSIAIDGIPNLSCQSLRGRDKSKGTGKEPRSNGSSLLVPSGGVTKINLDQNPSVQKSLPDLEQERILAGVVSPNKARYGFSIRSSPLLCVP